MEEILTTNNKQKNPNLDGKKVRYGSRITLEFEDVTGRTENHVETYEVVDVEKIDKHYITPILIQMLIGKFEGESYRFYLYDDYYENIHILEVYNR